MAWWPNIRTIISPGGGGGGGGGAQGAQGAQGAPGGDAFAAKLVSSPVLISSAVATGTTQPLTLVDSLFTGLAIGGAAVGAGGTAGVIGASFGSSGAETGTGANQGGLGSAASSTQPYNATDFPGQHFECQLLKANGEPPALLDMLSTANVSFPLSVAAPVYCYASFRSDLGADLKWRFFFYFRNQVTGVETSFTPNTSVTNVSLYVPRVTLAPSQPTSAGLGIPLAAQGAAEVEFGLTSDLVALGTAAAGATGKVMDAGSRLQMPRLDQVLAPTAAVAGNAQEATGWANPTAAQSLVTRDFQDKSRNPNTRAYLYDDFYYQIMPAANAAFAGPGSFFFSAAGAGTAATVLTSTNTERGYVNINVRTATGIGGVIGALVWSIVDANDLYFEYRGALTQLSNGTDAFTAHAGFFATQVAAPPNCAEFRTDTNTNYQFVVSKAGTPQTIDTGIPVDTAIHRFEILKAPSGNIIGKIDGTNVTGTGVTFANSPTVMMFGGFNLINSLGTGLTRNMTVDFIEIEERPASPRGA